MFISPGILAANVQGGTGGSPGTAIADDFNRANASDLGMSSEGWSWTRVAGTAGHVTILNNRYYKVHGSGNIHRAESDLGTVNMFTQLDAVAHGSTGSNDSDIGVLCRFDASALTFYEGQFRNLTATNEDQYRLLKNVAGLSHRNWTTDPGQARNAFTCDNFLSGAL